MWIMQKNFKVTEKFIFLSLVIAFIFILSNSLPAAASQKNVEIIDDAGRVIVLRKPSVRIAVLDEAHAENIVAVRAVGQLIGVITETDNKFIPKKIARLSTHPTFKTVAALKPDVIILERKWAVQNREFMAKVDYSGIPYILLDRPTWLTLQAYTLRLGKITGHLSEAKHALISLSRIMDRSTLLAARTAPQKVFVIAGLDFSTIAYDSWGALIINVVNGGLLPYLKGQPAIRFYDDFVLYGPKRLIEEGKDTDLIITLVNSRRKIPSLTKREIIENSDLQAIKAVREGRIIEMQESDLMLPSLIRIERTITTLWKYRNKK